MSIANRTQIGDAAITEAMQELWEQLRRRLEEKGRGTFASKHEILGILQEEMKEVEEAVQRHGGLAAHTMLADELLDLAVGCIFGVACIRAETLDW